MKEVIYKWKIKKEDFPIEFRALYGNEKHITESEIERITEEIYNLQFYLDGLHKKLEELA